MSASTQHTTNPQIESFLNKKDAAAERAGNPGDPPPVIEQQAATNPLDGGAVKETGAPPFKEQVNGYAKIIAGKVFRNPGEVEFGKKKLDGEL